MKEQDEKTKKFNYQAEIYIGGKEGNRIYFGKPVIFDENREHYMFPNEARLRNMTYGITIHLDVEVIYKIIEDDQEKITESVLEKIYFGKFPIMINSDLCILNKLDPLIKFNMGECKNDPGGYFIIDGKEKVLVPQEKFADNMLYIRDNYNDIYSHSAEIRSVSEDASKPIRTLSIRIARESTKLTNNNIVVNVPNVRKPVPLFILMRALGVTSDKDIIKYCLLDDKKYSNYMNLFIPSIHDAGNIFNQEVALKYMASLTKGKTIPHILQILMDYLLPHIGENNFIDKAYFIGYMVKELLKVYTGDKKPTDRDSFNFKRVELSGSLIYDLFKEYYTLQQKHIYQKIDKEYYYKQGIYQKDFISLIENNYNEIFKERILENGFKKAFKGNWGSEEHTKRPEVIQDLNRLSFNSFLSHLRKINLPLDSSAKVVGPRLLHSSQWGIIDPVDTPDGGNVGLHKHMALGAYLTSGYSSKKMIELLRKVIFVEQLTECRIEYIAANTKIFVNGAWIGVVREPENVIKILKLYRRLGLIPIFTSISWNIREDSIFIYTDSGRLCRPIFYVEDMKPSYDNIEIMKYLETNNFNYFELLIGFNKFKEKYRLDDVKLLENFIKENNVFFNIDQLYDIEKGDPDEILKKLSKNCGIIEYIDTAETETSLIATYIDKIQKQTSHLEIHPSLLLGIMGNQIVFPENNQLPRDLFSCGQSKQGVSLYNSNYQNRIDKMGVVLNYGQIPLVKSKYLKYIYNEQHPYGVNCIVAIGCYGSYNVEDSILFNEGSIKRGMFNTTYLNMYEAREESSKVAGNQIDSKFTNIELEQVLGKKPGYDYSVLNNFGLIKENTVLDDKKVIIGKVTTNPDKTGFYNDASVTPKKGQLGFVDKSFITDGEEGFRIAKVRIREERIPAIGDKFCSRCGQKGTVGLIIPENSMPFTNEGIRPDLIINPHALPSRMTIGQLVETLTGKSCAIMGSFGDCTAFNQKGSKHEIYGDLLRNYGYSSTGNELMYSGETGEQMEMQMFIGPCYYMRLKHMVKDKINYRAQGPRTVLTRQTVQGRANDGGLRIGEMERDGIIGHGATFFLQESMLTRGDNYYMAICNTTGTVAIYNESRNIFLSPMADGPLKFNTNIEGEKNIEVISKFGRNFSIVRIPYSFKLLLQELQTMNIQMRIITEDNIDQITSMSGKYTLDHIKNNLLSSSQKLELEKPEEKEEDLTTKDIVEKDKEKTDSEQKADSEEEDDEEGLSQVTRDSIRRAEEEYEKYKDMSDSDNDSDDGEKPPIELGEKIDDLSDLGIQDLNSKKIESAKEESAKEESAKEESAKEESAKEESAKEESEKDNKSILEIVTETLTGKNDSKEQEEENSNTSSDKKKTIKIDGQ